MARFEVGTKNILISNYGFGGTNACCILSPGNINYQEDTETDVDVFFSNSNKTKMNKSIYFKEHVTLENDSLYLYRSNKDSYSKVKPVNKLAFICHGQGSQWNNMGKELINRVLLNLLTKRSEIFLNNFYL